MSKKNTALMAAVFAAAFVGIGFTVFYIWGRQNRHGDQPHNASKFGVVAPTPPKRVDGSIKDPDELIRAAREQLL